MKAFHWRAFILRALNLLSPIQRCGSRLLDDQTTSGLSGSVWRLRKRYRRCITDLVITSLYHRLLKPRDSTWTHHVLHTHKHHLIWAWKVCSSLTSPPFPLMPNYYLEQANQMFTAEDLPPKFGSAKLRCTLRPSGRNGLGESGGSPWHPIAPIGRRSNSVRSVCRFH